MTAPTVAALFVRDDGPYAGRPDVDAWTEDRDARLYWGPHPVVAHPPCARWSKLAHMHGKLGQDDGCFIAALTSARRWGGVIEHPEGSYAWRHFKLPVPVRGTWTPDDRGGWSTVVDQARYGHRAQKRTWLYVVSGERPRDLDWREGEHAPELRPRPGRRAVGSEVLSRRQRELTPPAFAELLIALARESR